MSQDLKKESAVRRAVVNSPVVIVLACLLVGKTIVSVLLAYPDYFPPNFHADFLLGRRAYFFGTYQWAFYAHIISGPLALAFGLTLLSESLRRRLPGFHRRLGRIHAMGVMFVVAPSGLWMAWYASTGWVAGIAFAALACITALCAAMGWRAALRRNFDGHRMWMQRCYALLCSAVVLRVMGGLADVLDIDWTYPLAAWLSWWLPLIFLEAHRRRRQDVRLRQWSA